jgi:hypothetical protein
MKSRGRRAAGNSEIAEAFEEGEVQCSALLGEN